MKIPEVINDMRAYLDGADDMISVKEVELPELKSLDADITGIGVAGKINAPIEGHFDGMESKLKWQVPTSTSTKLMGGKPVTLELYADVQGFDSGTNSYTHDRYRVAMRGRVKSHKPGSFKAGESTDSETTIETHYLKVEIGDKTICEIDKYGYKCVVDGEDLLTDVRSNIGM